MLSGPEDVVEAGEAEEVVSVPAELLSEEAAVVTAAASQRLGAACADAISPVPVHDAMIHGITALEMPSKLEDMH